MKKVTRLRITIDFNKSKEEDIRLYEQLIKHSSPGAYIKDVLKGLVPIPSKIDSNS